MAQVVQSVNGMINNETEMKSMDANRYATKKTIAQGMLDIALLTANAAQLKYVIQVGEQYQFYKVLMALISLSIIFQICAGILLMIQSLISINKGKKERKIADVLNHIIIGLIYLSVFCDVIKMNFGLYPAVADLEKDV